MKKLSIRIFAVILCMLCLTGSVSAVQLAPGNHADWVDRIAKPSPDYVTDFCRWLEENTGADGALANPGRAEYIDNRYYAKRVVRFEGTVTFSYDTANSSSAGSAFNEAIASQHNLDEVYSMLHIAYQAFQQDHPEVFWLTGATMTTFTHNGSTYRRDNGTATGTYCIDVIFILRRPSPEFDVRAPEYRSAASVAAGIALRDKSAAEILASTEITTAKNRYEQVRALNYLLTIRNCYNSKKAVASEDDNTHGRGYDAYSCISALDGRTGIYGPVCAGYSEAFKVLCDRLGIPCTLVTGDTDGEFHQWNYVQMDDGNWYAVDVTWNDPTLKGITSAVSGDEQETYLLIGSSTMVGGDSFADSHIVTNRSGNNIYLTNGPRLSVSAYNPANTQPLDTKPTTGTILGDVLYTDICAYIDNRPIRSYNINNNTYIVVEDLLGYGFDVQWIGSERKLLIGTTRTAHPILYTTTYVHPTVTQPSGTPAMPYYFTDITTWIGTTQVTGYNIGGLTCICLDDLAAHFSTGYVWDGAARTLRLSTVK